MPGADARRDRLIAAAKAAPFILEQVLRIRRGHGRDLPRRCRELIGGDFAGGEAALETAQEQPLRIGPEPTAAARAVKLHLQDLKVGQVGEGCRLARLHLAAAILADQVGNGIAGARACFNATDTGSECRAVQARLFDELLPAQSGRVDEPREPMLDFKTAPLRAADSVAFRRSGRGGGCIAPKPALGASAGASPGLGASAHSGVIC